MLLSTKLRPVKRGDARLLVVEMSAPVSPFARGRRGEGVYIHVGDYDEKGDGQQADLDFDDNTHN